MDRSQSNDAIVVSALVVGGVYLYRYVWDKANGKLETKTVKLSEAESIEVLAGLNGQLATPAHFLIAYGAVYFGLSLVSMLSPTAGGGFAVLVAVGDFLTNGLSVVTSLSEGERKSVSVESLAK